MDTMNNYSNIIKRILLKYAQMRPSHGNIRLEVVFDDIHQRYALMQVGWNRGQRVRGNLLYITLNNGQVWLEYDGIGYGISQELINQGIAEKDIILAYLPQEEFAEMPLAA